MRADSIKEVRLQDGSKRYKVVIDVGADPNTSKRLQRRYTARTQPEAKAWIAETRTAAKQGKVTHHHAQTVASWLDEWLETRTGIRDTTRAGYRDALAPYRREVGHLPLKALTARHVEHVRDRLESGELRRAGRRGGKTVTGGAPLSPRTIRLGLQVLSQALDRAVRRKLITVNVVRDVDRPTGAGKAGTSWTLEQAAAFRAVAGTDRLAAAWALTMRGLRRGEVLGLRWSDVDLTSGTISITATRVKVDGAVLNSVPKTERGVRDLPVGAELATALAALLELQRHERAAAGAAYIDHGLVVVDEVGTPMRPEAYSKKFAALAREAGVPVVRLHDARHTFVSLARADGIPDAVVAAMAGHSEAVMRRTYSHLGVDMLRQYADRV